MSELRYYMNSSGEIVSVVPGHVDVEYTWLPNRTLRYTWILTVSLHATPATARLAEPAKWLTQSNDG